MATRPSPILVGEVRWATLPCRPSTCGAASPRFLALAALSAGYSIRLAWQSHTSNDISTASDATPLWLPQLAMAAGTAILAIAFLDELLLEWRGQRLQPSSDERLRNE